MLRCEGSCWANQTDGESDRRNQRADRRDATRTSGRPAAIQWIGSIIRQLIGIAWTIAAPVEQQEVNGPPLQPLPDTCSDTLQDLL